MTHDITNKHQVMLMNLEMLRSAVDIPPEKLTYLASCVKQLGRAMDTIRSVKIIADVGIGPVLLESVDLTASIRKGIEALENYHPYLGSRIDIDIPDHPVNVMADERLSLVIYHILNNSITHNHTDHPTIKISIEEHGGKADLIITDNGPGIGNDIIMDLSELSPREVSKAQGRGMGLTLISVLVKAYDGGFRLVSCKQSDDLEGTMAVISLNKTSIQGIRQ